MNIPKSFKLHLLIAALLFTIFILINYLLKMPYPHFNAFSYIPLPKNVMSPALIYSTTILSIIVNETIIAFYFSPSGFISLKFTGLTIFVLSLIYALSTILNLAIVYPSNYYMYDCLPVIKDNKFVDCLKDPHLDSYHSLFNQPIVITTSLYVLNCIMLTKLYDRLMPSALSLAFALPWLVCVIYSQVLNGNDYIIVFASLLISCASLPAIKLYK
eukprot:NODE_651_length_5002_cov_1.533347.p5 type:complete len:215 gc:universal NODE_651_length_5002_cov_1.533347:2901-3545(+)